jgi:hypothetical protein
MDIQLLLSSTHDNSFVRLFEVSDGLVSFTPAGHARYRARFSAAGVDIEAIRTIDELEEALALSWPFEQTLIADRLADRPSSDPLERDLLIAVTQGEDAKVEALHAILAARSGPSTHRRD